MAFGVSMHSIMYPKAIFSLKIVIEILNLIYWPIYGELGILKAINNEECGKMGQPECLDEMTAVVSFILLMFYMIIASVLLINLLIAVFR